ncbi:MAG TPA: rhodanese-like domain-containing protein [Acidiferrobacteraceae bacterium]|nr:rhodanese-like domain-containing protein [Acidiferrobacteraceae bacterium]
MSQFVINNWMLFVGLFVVLALLLYEPLSQMMYRIHKVSPLEVPKLTSRDSAVVVDVCESKEHKQGHIPESINIPLSRLSQDIEQLKKYREKPIILCCHSGNRSIKAAVMLRRNGFETVYALGGGMLAWEKENLPVER